MRAFDRRTLGDEERAALTSLAQLAAEPTSDAALETALERLVPPFPLKIQIQTQTRCNAACQMCPYPQIAKYKGTGDTKVAENFVCAQP